MKKGSRGLFCSMSKEPMPVSFKASMMCVLYGHMSLDRWWGSDVRIRLPLVLVRIALIVPWHLVWDSLFLIDSVIL